MSGTGKINDFVPIGTSLVGEVTLLGQVTGKNNKDEQIERLQKQLKEANEVIKKYMAVAFEIRSEEEKPTVLQLAFNYLEKWGVK